MNMLKRSAAFVFCLLWLLGTFSQTARADVIFVPEDSFYEAHRDACTYENRTYIANAPGGILTGYQNPESAQEKFQLDNGTPLYTSYVYVSPSGVSWGFADYYDAWFPLDYAYAKYDDRQFREDYSVKGESGELSKAYAGKTIYF